MDVTFTPEQDALRAAVRDLLADHSTRERVREVSGSETGSDPSLYRRLAELGAADLPGMVELGVVLEECGRVLAPVPIVSAVGIALPALAAAADELAGQVRTGTAIPVLAVDLDLVPEAHVATHVVWADGDDLLVAEAGDCAVEVLETMDSLRRLCRVSTEGVQRQRFAGAARAALAAAHRQGAVAVAHELVGVAQATLDMAVAHARQREQFGRPIGAYQAISHRCADMFVAVESARSHAYFAAWAIDAQDPGADLAASQAKASASHAAVVCAEGCIQVHGGIGFTWEHDAHLYLKRARSGAALLGTASQHRRRIADLLSADT
jgi:alkylation response protein AidB-like acyl-CoA dehydrogenase